MKFSEFIDTHGLAVDVAADEHVFRQGDRSGSIYLLNSGLLKAYYLSAEGRETIKSFVLPGDLIGSLAAAHLKEACTFNLVALEAAALTKLDFDEIYAAGRSDLQMASAVIDFLLVFAMKKERREKEFLTESAETRYRMLVDQSPGLLDKVRQKDIARYLGITPVALSRIRARNLRRA